MRCDIGRRNAEQNLICYGKSGVLTRKDSYKFLATEMHINDEGCNFGYFDLKQLKQSLIIIKKIKSKIFAVKFVQ